MNGVLIMKAIHVFFIVAIAFILLGCSMTVNVPTVETTTTQVLEISESIPSNVDTAVVQIDMGAGQLSIASGATKLVEGKISYNVATWEPKITATSNGVLISQEHANNIGIPNDQIKNNWDIKLGYTPIDLSISAGAYDGEIDLTGLSITNLEINDGASKAVVRFDSLNPAEMRKLVYKTGASQVDLYGLGNANTSSITFESGAGDYTLDFSGDLQKDMDVRISSGMSNTKIIVPNNAKVIIQLTGGLSNVNLTGTWTVENSTYTSGSGARTIHIYVEMAMGNLVLITK
jgi:predicted membrane protein